MKPESKLILSDTTLRDGAQTEGVSFSVQDKIKIIHLLDELGMGIIEGGWPGSNPKDSELFKIMKGKKLKNAKFTAFGSTRKASNPVEKDLNIKALIEAETEQVNIFCKGWDFHVKDILGITLEQNLELVYDSVEYLKRYVPSVSIGLEHFYDGYKSNPEYIFKLAKTAEKAGASWVGTADTNGGCLPEEIGKIFKEAHNRAPIIKSVHIHQDSGLAVAGTLKAIEGGATVIHGTINGLGERCGMADFCTLIPLLKLKYGIDVVTDEQLKRMKEISIIVAEACNMDVPKWSPFVGQNAFYHKGGVHVQAVLKNPKAYNHIDPEIVGNEYTTAVSELSGRANVLFLAKKYGIKVKKEDESVAKLLAFIKEREKHGFHYEVANASRLLLFKKFLTDYKSDIKVKSFSINMAQSDTDNGDPAKVEAKIAMEINGVNEEISVTNDRGPLSALGNAIIIGVKKHYPEFGKISTNDIKIRVLEYTETGIGKLRVLLQMTNEETGEKFTTVNASRNIETSFLGAFIDGIEYKLISNQKKGGEKQ